MPKGRSRPSAKIWFSEGDSAPSAARSTRIRKTVGKQTHGESRRNGQGGAGGLSDHLRIVSSRSGFERRRQVRERDMAVSYTHLRAHETGRNLVCRLLLEKKK